MAKNALPQPTDVELRILQVLWEIEPATVRQVHEHLSEVRKTDYATTVKMLRIMLEKGLVTRDDSVRPLVYQTAITQERAQKSMLSEFVDKLYEGSATTMVMHALSRKKASAADIAEIRRLLDQLERGGK